MLVQKMESWWPNGLELCRRTLRRTGRCWICLFLSFSLSVVRRKNRSLGEFPSFPNSRACHSVNSEFTRLPLRQRQSENGPSGYVETRRLVYQIHGNMTVNFSKLAELSRGAQTPNGWGRGLQGSFIIELVRGSDVLSSCSSHPSFHLLPPTRRYFVIPAEVSRDTCFTRLTTTTTTEISCTS